MQPQSTFGAFLVAFAIANGAPIVPESGINPDTSTLVDSHVIDPSREFHAVEKTFKPATNDEKYFLTDPANVIARDPKRSKSKTTSNEHAKTKGAEVGQNAADGFRTILNDKLDDATSGERTKKCARKGKESEADAEDDNRSAFSKLFNGEGDEGETGDEECEDMEGEEYMDEEANVDKRDISSRFASAKRGPPKGSSSGKGGSSKGYSSLGQDILTQTTSNIISDGLWHGVDQAIAGDAPAKRSPRGGKGGSSGKSSGKKQDGGSSIGQDILTETTGNIISDGIWYSVDQATSEDAAVKRSPRGVRFRPGGADVLTDVVTDWVPSGISSWFGGDDETGEGAKVKRSPKGGRFRQGGKDVLTDVVSDGISTGIWYGVDEATNAYAKLKRSPKGGRFRQGGKDVLTDVVADGISTGIWYGVDEATNEKRSSSVPDEALDPGFDIDPEEFKKMNYGLPPNTEPSIYDV